jgi:hypothetical protein
MPILLAGTIEFVHIEQISTLLKFRIIQVSLYMGTTGTNQNLIHGDINIRLNLGNAFHNSVQKPLSSRLLPKNVKVKTYQTLREEQGLGG